ncbi:MAG: glutamine--fructose-6-phosphate transaminase (isomerizing) [Pseudomonadota bacterium]
MCGIIGALAQRDVTPILIEGLRRLEYRGYDSAGVSVVLDDGSIGRVRAMGKVQRLADALDASPVASQIGIAHTRWATHGEPSERNAHPHNSSGKVSLVHNGIIENHEELRSELTAAGYSFTSETDTEVIAHLLHRELERVGEFLQAVRTTVAQLEGAYALAIINSDEPDRIIAVRRGSPLLLGVGVKEYFLASDTSALIPVTQQFVYLNDGDLIDVRRSGYAIEDEHGEPVMRELKRSELSDFSVDKGDFKHFMLKEIYEQPLAIRKTIEGLVHNGELVLDHVGQIDQAMLAQVEQIHLVACGTSSYAAGVARYWLEQYAGVPASVEIASEYRYRTVQVPKNTLYITLSQSGETADSMAALEETKHNPNYLASLAICNVPESSMTREADATLLTRAGTEIGVASTKAFVTQLAALLALTGLVARAKGCDEQVVRDIATGLEACAGLVEQALEMDTEIERFAEDFVEKHNAIFLGRGPFFPIALEGALKLKEISYIHAEGYPAGELKHGPLALIDNDMPVVTVAPNDVLLEKLKANMEEVRTRGGQLYVFAEQSSDIKDADGFKILRLPDCPESVAPIVFTIPVQLLSYHVAVMRGTDVDQPRNLAKSVTVE